MAFQHLQATRDGAVGVVTLGRPERRNALSLELLTELAEAVRALSAERETAAIILRASGPAYSAGHDLSEMVGRDQAFFRSLFSACTRAMTAIREAAQPVIAEVQGVATAAGCQLVASCDLAVAASTSRFATPGVKIGLFCSTPMVALSRAVPTKRALEMLLTGDFISADEALAAGLVGKVVPPEELQSATRALADKIASASKSVVALGKRAFWQQLSMPTTALAYAYAEEVMAANAGASDAQEGMRAFLEKRPPKWST